jgi:hypothetical protein
MTKTQEIKHVLVLDMDAKMEALENYGLDDNTYISVLEELQTLQTKFNSLVDTLQENKNA